MEFYVRLTRVLLAHGVPIQFERSWLIAARVQESGQIHSQKIQVPGIEPETFSVLG